MSSPRYIRAFSILSEKLMFLIHEMFRNTSESSREFDRSSTQCDQHPGLQLAYIHTLYGGCACIVFVAMGLRR